MFNGPLNLFCNPLGLGVCQCCAAFTASSTYFYFRCHFMLIFDVFFVYGYYTFPSELEKHSSLFHPLDSPEKTFILLSKLVIWHYS